MPDCLSCRTAGGAVAAGFSLSLRQRLAQSPIQRLCVCADICSLLRRFSSGSSGRGYAVLPVHRGRPPQHDGRPLHACRPLLLCFDQVRFLASAYHLLVLPVYAHIDWCFAHKEVVVASVIVLHIVLHMALSGSWYLM